LTVIQDTNQRLCRADLLKEGLPDALDCPQPERAMEKRCEWMAWVFRSKLKPFVRVTKAVRTRLSGLAAQLLSRMTNGFMEGLNNRIRMIFRRAFGLHSAEALSFMIFLNCSGVQLAPELPSPTSV